MTQADDFDELYAATWRPLLLQTFALCGDLGTAREALRQSFVDAWHHWGRAQRQVPESYVRSGAFARAQWRSRARALKRAQRVTREQRAALRALQSLPAQARKAVVLACLSELSVAEIARQVDEPERHTEELVEAGLTELAHTLALSPDAVAPRLRGLTGAARAAAQPTPEEVRRQGNRRHWTWLAAGTAAAVLATLLAGTFVRVQPVSTATPPPALGPTATSSMLMGGGGLKPLGSADSWRVLATSDNTTGDGINTYCQSARFADPHGLRAFVRTFRPSGTHSGKHSGTGPRSATQTIELSRTVGEAQRAFTTAVDWFAGCQHAGLQLLSSYDVRQLGDDAMVLKFRAQGAQLTSFAVGVARTGHLTTWTSVVTRGSRSPDTTRVVHALGNSVRRLCSSRAAGACATSPKISQDPPPPSGEQPGMLAVADLPPVGNISHPWVGTDAQQATDNAAATTCDHADFVAAGAKGPLARTFLIPKSRTPARFGLTETTGRFPRVAGAKAFVTRVRDRMNGCPDKDPGATITTRAEKRTGPRGSEWYLWRLESQISDKRTIVYWMGVSRFGSNVAQVGFVPGGGPTQDIDAATFEGLVTRSRDRLFELPAVRSGT
ncbi:MAG: sigma factor-like helix-turn-helix DNA-binding protein [Marmoricola sp.]